MLGAALSFVLLMLLPVDFAYPMFAGVLFLIGISMGCSSRPTAPR